MIRSRALALCLALVALTCVAADRAPMTPGQSGIWDGYIVEGERFGVRIGDTREQALAVLEARGHPAYSGGMSCTFYLKQIVDCSAMQSITGHRVVQLFWDGTIYLEFRDDRVVSIFWQATLRPYLDF